MKPRSPWPVRAMVALTVLFVLAAAGLGLKRHVERKLEASPGAGRRTVRWEWSSWSWEEVPRF